MQGRVDLGATTSGDAAGHIVRSPLKGDTCPQPAGSMPLQVRRQRCAHTACMLRSSDLSPKP